MTISPTKPEISCKTQQKRGRKWQILRHLNDRRANNNIHVARDKNITSKFDSYNFAIRIRSKHSNWHWQTDDSNSNFTWLLRLRVLPYVMKIFIPRFTNIVGLSVVVVVLSLYPLYHYYALLLLILSFSVWVSHATPVPRVTTLVVRTIDETSTPMATQVGTWNLEQANPNFRNRIVTSTYPAQCPTP